MAGAHIFAQSVNDKMKKRIRIQGFIMFLSIVITILLSKFLFPHWKQKIWDEFLDAIGIALVLCGFLFRISARGYKSERSSDGNILMADGPYALIRNPMYFGTLLIGSGIVFALFQWWVFFMFFSIFLAIYIPQIRKEEKKLYSHFGDEYAAYCKKIPRYFPSIAGLFKLKLNDYLPLKWPWMRKEFSSLITVIGIVLAIEGWQDARAFGFRGYVKELLKLFLIAISFIAIFILFYAKNVERKH